MKKQKKVQEAGMSLATNTAYGIMGTAPQVAMPKKAAPKEEQDSNDVWPAPPPKGWQTRGAQSDSPQPPVQRSPLPAC